MKIVGIVSSTGSLADTAANVYIPLKMGFQDLLGRHDVVSTVYVQAESADQIALVQSAIEDEPPRPRTLAVGFRLNRLGLARARPPSSRTSARGSLSA